MGLSQLEPWRTLFRFDGRIDLRKRHRLDRW
jgi:hypothetical protein